MPRACNCVTLLPARPRNSRQASAWTPGRPADEDAETARILASYPPEVFQPSNMDGVLGHGDQAAAEKKLGLELLARARIKTVPVGFSSSLLLEHIRDWQLEFKEWEIGPEPPAADRNALESVISATRRLTTALDHLKGQMSRLGSRIANSTFAAHWDQVRLERLRRKLDHLRSVAESLEVRESMRRENHPLKPKGGWSAREALFGHDIPALYSRIFGRRFTASGKTDIPPSEGVRFACIVATEVLGDTVRPENVVKQRTNYRAAQGGKREHK